MGRFAQNLATGRVGESCIAEYLKGRGHHILPVYEKEISEGKGPQFYSADGEFPAPDMFVFPMMEWVEAKHKSVFSWYRIGERWVTGIDLHHYLAYLRTQELSKRRVWLFFLHRSNQPDPRDLDHGCPPECPTGLFIGSLDFLSKVGVDGKPFNESHRSKNHGRHGMVYWADTTLKKVAEISELDVALNNEAAA